MLFCCYASVVFLIVKVVPSINGGDVGGTWGASRGGAFVQSFFLLCKCQSVVPQSLGSFFRHHGILLVRLDK